MVVQNEKQNTDYLPLELCFPLLLCNANDFFSKHTYKKAAQRLSPALKGHLTAT